MAEPLWYWVNVRVHGRLPRTAICLHSLPLTAQCCPALHALWSAALGSLRFAETGRKSETPCVCEEHGMWVPGAGAELDIDSEAGKGLLSTCWPGLSSRRRPRPLLICLRRGVP